MTNFTRLASLARSASLLLFLLAAALVARPGDAQAGGQIIGTIPGPGSLGLVVWSGGPVEEITAALGSSGCSARSVWVTSRSGGRLIGYLFGAPDAVNTGFRAELGGTTLPAQTPFVLVCAPAATAAPAPPPSSAGALVQSEAQMLGLINADRTASGLAPFVLDATLVEVARRHSADMVARNYFGHVNPEGLDPFERMAAMGISGYQAAAENIAWAGDAALAHTALMNSPGHRTNLMNPQLGRIGIGIVRKDALHIMVTQVFRD